MIKSKNTPYFEVIIYQHNKKWKHQVLLTVEEENLIIKLKE